jgi:hypothetical protein
MTAEILFEASRVEEVPTMSTDWRASQGRSLHQCVKAYHALGSRILGGRLEKAASISGAIGAIERHPQTMTGSIFLVAAGAADATASSWRWRHPLVNMTLYGRSRRPRDVVDNTSLRG